MSSSGTMPISDLLLACSYWMQQQIEALIPSINTKVTGMYSVESDPALVDLAVVVGELANANSPTICVWAESGSPPKQLDVDEEPNFEIKVLYKIRVVLPEVGGGHTVQDFELTKQITLGFLFQLFWDASKTLQPTVFTKSDPEVMVTADPSRTGDWRSIYAKPLADTVTLARSADLCFTFQFQISGDTVLSALVAD